MHSKLGKRWTLRAGVLLSSSSTPGIIIDIWTVIPMLGPSSSDGKSSGIATATLHLATPWGWNGQPIGGQTNVRSGLSGMGQEEWPVWQLMGMWFCLAG